MNYWESHTQVAVLFRRFDRKRRVPEYAQSH